MAKHAFVPYLAKVTLSNGEDLVLPRLTLRRILALTESLSKVVVALKPLVPDLFDIEKLRAGQFGIDPAALISRIPQLLSPLYDEIIEVLVVYLGKDMEWIDDTFDLEDMIKVCVPLFGSIISQGTQLATIITTAIEQMSAAIPVTDKTPTPTISENSLVQ